MGIGLIIFKIFLGFIIALGVITILRLLVEFNEWIKEKTNNGLFFWIAILLVAIGFLYLCFHIGGAILNGF